jgi:hypothetical protein
MTAHPEQLAHPASPELGTIRQHLSLSPKWDTLMVHFHREHGDVAPEWGPRQLRAAHVAAHKARAAERLYGPDNQPSHE